MPRRLAGTTGVQSHDPRSVVSSAIRVGDLVFVSGVLPHDDDGQLVTGDITHQAHAVMKRLAAVITQAGCTMNDVAKCTVWLADPADLEAFNKVYASYFEEPWPARTTLRADLIEPHARVQIEALCHKPRSRVYPHIMG
jgi:reactive intermediate/imine deaminase